MPILTLPLNGRRRALVPVELAVPAARARALRQAGQTVPASLRLEALLDTGAGRTCMDPVLAQALNLKPFGTVALAAPASSPAAPVSHYLYKVNLTILHTSGNTSLDLKRNAFTVVTAHLSRLGIDILIGRDVLALCRFVYDGQRGEFSLEY